MWESVCPTLGADVGQEHGEGHVRAGHVVAGEDWDDAVQLLPVLLPQHGDGLQDQLHLLQLVGSWSGEGGGAETNRQATSWGELHNVLPLLIMGAQLCVLCSSRGSLRTAPCPNPTPHPRPGHHTAIFAREGGELGESRPTRRVLMLLPVYSGSRVRRSHTDCHLKHMEHEELINNNYQQREFSPSASRQRCSQRPTCRWLWCSCWGRGADGGIGTTW